MWVKICAFSVHGVYGRDFRLILFLALGLFRTLD